MPPFKKFPEIRKFYIERKNFCYCSNWTIVHSHASDKDYLNIIIYAQIINSGALVSSERCDGFF